jgi:hypothetical protein
VSSEDWENVINGIIGLVLTIVLIIAGMAFCKYTLDAMTENLISRSDFYSAKGINGTHNLVVLDSTGNELQGSFSGKASYFLVLGSGSVKGSVSTGDVIQFEWIVPTGKSQIIEVPYSVVLWDFNDEYTQPTFEFNFTQTHLEMYIDKHTEIINFNTLFTEAEAITMHTTRERYIEEVQSKLKK